VGGGEGRFQRVLSPEVEAANASIRAASSWRELQRILESAGGGGSSLDPFQLVAMLSRAVALPSPGAHEPDDLADYQGFVAGVYGWLLSKVELARPQQLGLAVSCVARLGLYNAELVGALVAKSERELHNFGDQDIVLLLEGMATLGYAPEPSFADQLLRRTQDRLRTMESRNLAALLGALPRLGLTPSPEWTAAYADAALATVRNFNATQFSSLVVNLASVGWRPSGPAQLQPLVDRCYPLLQYELRVDRDRSGRATAAPAVAAPAAAPGAAAGADSTAAAGAPPQQQPQQQQQQQNAGQQRWGQQRRSERPGPVEPQVAIDWLVNVAWALAQMVAGTGARLPQQWTTAVFDKLQVGLVPGKCLCTCARLSCPERS
jgi:hypothetical protein